MSRSYGRLLEGTESRLREALKEAHPASRYVGCIKVCEAAIHQMKEAVLSEPFADGVEEISHFKYEAPEIYGQLFFFLSLKRIEEGRPHSDPEAFQKSLLQEKQRLDEFFQEHDHICRYYNQGATYLDQHLFMRRPEDQWVGDERGTFIPKDFTIGTFYISKIKANGRLRNWIRSEFESVSGVRKEEPVRKNLPLRWSRPKSDLVLLLDALFEAKCFNDGLCTLKEVMEWGEEVFGVTLPQYHVTIGEISIKKDPFKFLKLLTEAIRRKFESLL
jgi:hypothetical protein